MIRSAASIMRIRPSAMMALAQSAPPEGLTSTAPARPSDSRRMISCGLKMAEISATSIGPPS